MVLSTQSGVQQATTTSFPLVFASHFSTRTAPGTSRVHAQSRPHNHGRWLKKKTPTSFDRTGAQRKGHHWHGDARPVSTTPCRVGSSDRRIVRWGRRLPDVCFCRKRRKSERKQSEINSKTHKEKAVRKITKTRRNKNQERKIDTHAGIWKRKRNEEKHNACLLFAPNQTLRRPAPTPVWGEGGGGLSLFSFNGTMPF